MAAITAEDRERLFGPKCSTGAHVTWTTPWGDKVRVHRLVLPVFQAACRDAERLGWKPSRIDSYACRSIRGSDSTSLHSYALAWDFFATDEGVPPPGGVWKPENTVPAEFAACFERYGFRWGRHFTRQDWPHIEWADRPPKPIPVPVEVHMALGIIDYLIDPHGQPDDKGRWPCWGIDRNGSLFAFNGAASYGGYGELVRDGKAKARDDFRGIEYVHSADGTPGYVLICDDFYVEDDGSANVSTFAFYRP